MPTPDPAMEANRRPLATRELGVVKRLADLLARTPFTPNGISLGGLICGIFAGALFAATSHFATHAWWCWLGAALFIQLRLAANMFDGMVALRTGAASKVGELFNEIPDRVSDAATLAGLGYAIGGTPALGLSAACLAVFIAYIRVMGKVAGGEQEFCGPMAKPQRMALATVTALWCGLTPLSWHAFGALSVPDLALWIVLSGGAATVVRRLARIARTLHTKR